MKASVAVGLGSIAAEQTIFAMLAPAVVPPLYAATEERSPNTCYWLAMALVTIGFLVSLTLPNLEQLDDQPENGQSSVQASSGGTEGRSRRNYTKRLASERQSDYRKALLDGAASF